MRFVRCGLKLFRPDTVTAVHLYDPGQAEPDETAIVVVPGDRLFFRGAEAEAIRTFFGRIPATDLMRREEEEAPEAVAPNHSQGEC
jgi:hypothetical protein